jgi:uncharacterized membrane protein
MLSKPYLWHPIFVHFSIALLTVGTVFYLLGAIARKSRYRGQWMLVGQWNLWLGIGFTVFTVGFGLLAYATVPHDESMHEAMTLHRNLALTTAAIYAVLAIWLYIKRSTAGRTPIVLVLTLIVGLCALASTAFVGGELVFGRGVGVASLPKSDAAVEEASKHKHGDHHPRHSDDHKHKP